MQIVLGAGAIAFIFLAFLTLITIYWLLTQWNNFARQIPVVGGALGSLGQKLLNANLALINDVLVVGHSVVSWSEDRVSDGFKFLHDLYSAAIVSQVGALQAGVNGMQFWKDTVATAAITSLNSSMNALQAWQVGFAQLNIDAFNAWKDRTDNLLKTLILPNVDKLLALTTIISTVTLPTMSNAIVAVQASVLDLISNVVKPMRQDLTDLADSTAITLKAPGVGVLPRLGTVEGDLAQILPWAAAIGLTIPAALNLAKLAKNPCWCATEGPLQDNGTLELATLMDLL